MTVKIPLTHIADDDDDDDRYSYESDAQSASSELTYPGMHTLSEAHSLDYSSNQVKRFPAGAACIYTYAMRVT